MYEENLFLNQNGNTIIILERYSQENKLVKNHPGMLSKSFVVKKGIKEMKIISVDEIMVLTPDGDIIVFNSNGKEISTLKNLLTKKQVDDGWKIRGLEVCPEQTYISVV